MTDPLADLIDHEATAADAPMRRLTEYVACMTAGNRSDTINIVASSAYRGGTDYDLRLSDLRVVLEELKALRRLRVADDGQPDEAQEWADFNPDC